ncbi:MAG: DUF6471 domain-containing protein [Caulobacter sp.]|nr:DUF6471 domain-containing protein [Caulobacter sp.]
MDEELALKWVKGTIRAEMNKRDLTYADLVDRLKNIGVEENERNLRNKVARGTFSALFFIQCLEAIGVVNLKIDLMEFLGEPARKPDHMEEVSKALSKRDAAQATNILERVRAILDEEG